jgi:cell division protein FtsZ
MPGMNALAIKVIGIGGAGANFVEQLTIEGAAAATFALVHTNARLLERSPCPERVLLGAKRLRGLGAAGDPDLGRAVSEEESEKLQALCSGADLVFIAAGLGGGTATGAAPVLARIAKERGALVLGVVALPFEFEGQRRQHQAQEGLGRLRAAADGVICLHNQKVSELLNEDTRAIEIFSAANGLWAEGVRGILHMLTRRGLIHVDFADIASVLRGRRAESCFASVEAAGERRSREVIEKLLTHPLLESGRALTEADALLVNLAGGPDLTMADVNHVMDQLRRQPENAQLVMGASICEELAGRLRITIIASKFGKAIEAKRVVMDLEAIAAEAVAANDQIETQFFSTPEVARTNSRFVPPAPDLPEGKKDQMFAEQNGKAGRVRKATARLRQTQLPLEIVSKDRFEKAPPTIHRGEDLDVPTYIRRGIKLN